MAKEKITVGEREFEKDTDTEIIEEVIKTEKRVPIDWLNRKNARQSYIDRIAEDQERIVAFDAELEALMPGVTWEDITDESEKEDIKETKETQTT